MLALDYGERRVGVAVCDASRTFVFGRETILRAGAGAEFAALAKICAADAIRLVVVGLPINADGSEGGSARVARAFAARVKEATGLPVLMVDERYTTIEADELLQQRFRDWRERKTRVDQAAATLILRTFLEHGSVA